MKHSDDRVKNLKGRKFDLVFIFIDKLQEGSLLNKIEVILRNSN